MMTKRVKRIIYKHIVRISIAFGMVLIAVSLFVSQADSRLNASGSSAVAPNQAVVDSTPSFMASNLTPIPFSYPATPLLSAQHACQQIPGWQWRSGGGFTMCFKTGYNLCPAGYPWIRQTTAHYTICVYMDNMGLRSNSGTPR